MMRKYLVLITMSVLSFGLIVVTPSCDDDNPEVVVGDKGNKGDKGDKGEKGDKGDLGPEGETGERGPSGPKGDKGDQGDPGVTGSTGSKGDKGDQGEQGDTGPKGDQGNANVKRFTFTVNANDWDSGAHFGSDNNHSYFTVDKELTGDIFISDSKYVVLAYARPSGGGNDYREMKQLPYTYNVNNNYGIFLELLPSRRYLTISKTTNGFNYYTVPLNERPTSIFYTIIMVEVGTVSAHKGKVDFTDFKEVSNYFELN